MRSHFCLAIVGVCLLGASTATASIVIDPGPVGSTVERISVSFPDLNGTPINGQFLTLDIVFSNDKYVEWITRPAVPGPAEQMLVDVVLTLDTTYTYSGGNSGSVTAGFLSDENANPIAPLPDFLNGSGLVPPGNPTDSLSYRMQWTPSLPSLQNKPFFDAHYSITLPNLPGAAIIQSEFTVIYFSHTDPLVEGLVVGQSDGDIPEPTTFVVWSLLGLTVGGVYRWRRRRA